MRRRGLSAAVAVALLLVALVPGAVSAAPIRLGNLDQNVAQQDAGITIDSAHPVTQSFTAGATGRLVYVELYCAGGSRDTMVSIGVGSFGVPTWWCSTTPGWVAFPFFLPRTVQAGTQYTMTIKDEDPSSSLALFGSASDYAGGCLGSGGTCTGGDPTDIAFRTYVQPFPNVSLAWSPTTLTPGTPAPVTLTLQADFPGYVVPPGGHAVDRLAQIKIDPLPAWFTPTGVTCSAPISPASCDLQMVAFGTWDLDTTGSPFSVTVAVTGTATLPAGGGSASGAGCIAYAFYFDPYIDCTPARADLGIDGAPPTPPATTLAADEAPPMAPAPFLLPGVLCFVLGSLVCLDVARRRTARSRA